MITPTIGRLYAESFDLQQASHAVTTDEDLTELADRCYEITGQAVTVPTETAADVQAQPDESTPIAVLFGDWLTIWHQMNASKAGDFTDEQLSEATDAMNAAEDAIIALPAVDADDVWRKVVTVLTGDGPEAGTQAAQLLASGRLALCITA